MYFIDWVDTVFCLYWFWCVCHTHIYSVCVFTIMCVIERSCMWISVFRRHYVTLSNGLVKGVFPCKYRVAQRRPRAEPCLLCWRRGGLIKERSWRSDSSIIAEEILFLFILFHSVAQSEIQCVWSKTFVFNFNDFLSCHWAQRKDIESAIYA